MSRAAVHFWGPLRCADEGARRELALECVKFSGPMQNVRAHLRYLMGLEERTLRERLAVLKRQFSGSNFEACEPGLDRSTSGRTNTTTPITPEPSPNHGPDRQSRSGPISVEVVT